ncbi:hypothetical protein DENIS_5029 [Desulfonema ishimotonii]|uniref:Uncharacterized protein n=1 Tax=Desulfonema ishimotonii TaxID=45657 RepID=A0A401G461_9BACT|nr:hypothetical protein [Desulfonema ishimotonii]GBC64029.1 hypothetical protein DENIS_5029 [Desulfonema ishimotonii]
MAFWRIREELSLANRLRRSYYELLRDQLDQLMIQHALIDSYANFQSREIPYPFVEKRELKPRALIPDREYEAQNAFLVIFIEDTIPDVHKKYIRFFDANRTTKKNLLRAKTLPLSNNFERFHKYLESARFSDFLKILLPVDYALLIQRDPVIRARDRYNLSHFHVRIDWPIADAAEDLARRLRYISKDLYEKGDKYAEDIQKKFFEYYGLPVMVGGRRTAACVAAQYLRQIGCIATVYAGSSESRALIRLSERGVSKLVLMRLKEDDVRQIAEANDITLRSFRKNYVVTREKKSSICIFQASYSYTHWARPPEDGKLRELKPDLYWLSVDNQQLIPRPGGWQYPPLPLNIIYS